MTLEIARSFFLWCSIINYALLLVWAPGDVLARWGLPPMGAVVPALARAVRHVEHRGDYPLQDGRYLVQHCAVHRASILLDEGGPPSRSFVLSAPLALTTSVGRAYDGSRDVDRAILFGNQIASSCSNLEPRRLLR